MARVSPDAAAVLEKLIGAVPTIPPIAETLDATLVEVGEGRSVFSMNVHRGLFNYVNVVHGGVLTSLAELAASVAILTTLAPTESFTFVSQTTTHERPVTRGKVRADARVVRRGRTVSLVEVVEQDSDEREVARSHYTVLTRAIEKA